VKITPSKINTLLTIGENLNIEFKRAGDGPKADTFESICAFLNKAGGDLLLGVDDDGTVVGLPQTATAQESVLKGSGVNDGVNEKVNERQRSIISSVSSNPYITQVELATMLGISIVHVNKNMKKLQALGIIRRVGPDKGGHWEVIG